MITDRKAGLLFSTLVLGGLGLARHEPAHASQDRDQVDPAPPGDDGDDDECLTPFCNCWLG